MITSAEKVGGDVEPLDRAVEHESAEVRAVRAPTGPGLRRIPGAGRGQVFLTRRTSPVGNSRPAPMGEALIGVSPPGSM
jgi:hypothetical protein